MVSLHLLPSSRTSQAPDEVMTPIGPRNLQGPNRTLIPFLLREQAHPGLVLFRQRKHSPPPRGSGRVLGHALALSPHGPLTSRSHRLCLQSGRSVGAARPPAAPQPGCPRLQHSLTRTRVPTWPPSTRGHTDPEHPPKTCIRLCSRFVRPNSLPHPQGPACLSLKSHRPRSTPVFLRVTSWRRICQPLFGELHGLWGPVSARGLEVPAAHSVSEPEPELLPTAVVRLLESSVFSRFFTRLSPLSLERTCLVSGVLFQTPSSGSWWGE